MESHGRDEGLLLEKQTVAVCLVRVTPELSPRTKSWCRGSPTLTDSATQSF